MFKNAIMRSKGIRLYHRRVSISILFTIILTILPAHGFPPRKTDMSEKLSLFAPLKVQWLYETGDTLDLTPATYDDLIFLPLEMGKVIALRLTDGKLAWKAEVGGEITASPEADLHRIYVSSAQNRASGESLAKASAGSLRAIGTQGGITLWMISLESPIQGEIATSETTLFGCSVDGRIFAISKDAGKVLWEHRAEAPCIPRPTINEDRLFVAATNGTISALDPRTGRTLWRYRTGEVITSLASTDIRLVLGTEKNFVYSLSAADGALLWRYKTKGSIQSVVPTSGSLLVTSLDNYVYFLNQRKGKLLWKRQLPGRVAAPPLALADAALFAPLSGDECVILGLKNGKKLNAVYVGEDNNTAASPIISGKTLLLTTRLGLMAFGVSR